MTARDDLRQAICWPYGDIDGTADALIDEHAAEVRAAALREAADFVRDAHFRDGLTVQEIGTALRHQADAIRPSTEGTDRP